MVIADTGFWLALANLLLRRLGVRSQVAFVESFAKGAFQVFDLTPGHAPRIARLMKKYRELPMDLADASLVILAEHLGRGKILSTDERDFRAHRWKKTQPFENLLL